MLNLTEDRDVPARVATGPNSDALRDGSWTFLHALTEAVLPVDEIKLENTARDRILNEVAAFLQGQIEALPRRLRWMFGFGMLGFRAVVILTHFRNFTALSESERRRAVELWAYGRFGLGRSLFRLVRSTALLAFYEFPEVEAALAAASGSPSEASR